MLERRETLQWVIGRLMAYFRLDRTAVWGHGELRQYGNSTSCPGQHFLPDVQAFRQGQDFWAAPAGTPDLSAVRWQVVDTNGTQLGLFNVTTNAVAAAEQASSVGIYRREGQIRIDFRNAQNANPDAPAKWQVCAADDTPVGLFNQTPAAVEQAERIQGYARYLYDNATGTTRLDFRNLGQ